MASYNIEVSESALKQLKKIPKQDVGRVVGAIQSLVYDPYPSGVRKLGGETDVFRIRVGKYRVIYEVKKKVLLILVLKIGHRGDVYRNL